MRKAFVKVLRGSDNLLLIEAPSEVIYCFRIPVDEGQRLAEFREHLTEQSIHRNPRDSIIVHSLQVDGRSLPVLVVASNELGTGETGYVSEGEAQNRTSPFCSKVAVFYVRVAPQDDLECDRLDPSRVHLFDLLGCVALLC